MIPEGNDFTAPADREWCEYDFEVNKYLWLNRGIDKAEPYRYRNLVDLVDILEDSGVTYWLQGRTLLGLHDHGVLLDDHDDDIGVFEEDRGRIQTIACHRLKAAGFSLIRDTDHIISFIRDDRYIDLCLFRSRGSRIGYGKKWFPKRHFASFDSVEYKGRDFAVPSDAQRLLRHMYAPALTTRGVRKLRGLIHPSRYIRLYKRMVRKAARRLPHILRKRLNLVFRTAGIKYAVISVDEFLTTLIEPDNSFNWRWRGPHLNIITDHGRCRQVGEIIQLLGSNNGLERLSESIRETDTSRPFYEPANYDQRFWQSGNNYFAYCIVYQFREDIVPYARANEYIRRGQRPHLYTSEYYESRRSLTDNEIEKLLRDDPIELVDGAITSGKHRACAMIGRLISGKPYIPFWSFKTDL